MTKTYNIIDADIVGAWVKDKYNGFRIEWDSDRGFGQFDFTIEKEHPFNITIDNECMSRDFIKAVLNKIVDSSKLTSEEG